MMMLNLIFNHVGTGYIAGIGDGIVTVKGEPTSRRIWLMNAKNMAVEESTISLSNGHYMFIGLDPKREYLVIARDYKKEFEPFAWDYVKPANDITVSEQLALKQSWANI